MKRRIWILGSLLGLCALFGYLLLEQGSLMREPELLEVSVILRENDASGLANARKGMEQAASDYHVELRLLVPTNDNDANEQAEILSREIQLGADAVLLIPAGEAEAGAVVEAAFADTAIVTLETDLCGFGADVCVGIDDAALGAALCAEVMRDIPTGSGILLLDSLPGENAVAERCRSAKASLEQAGYRPILYSMDEESTLPDAARGAMAVLAFEDSALKSAARIAMMHEGFPPIYGMGSSAAAAAGLEQGNIRAIMVQNTYAAGYLSVEAAARLARRQPMERIPPMEFTPVRQADMYEPEYQKLLFPVT